MFAGLRLDTAMHEEVMRRRLRKLGITVRAARSSAALELAQTLPAAILADLSASTGVRPRTGRSSQTPTGHATQQHAEPPQRPEASQDHLRCRGERRRIA
jgi:CheY-like chemotaxis protein